MSIELGKLGSVVVRCGLGFGFLSAVADRIGLWGAFGAPNVEWGNFSRFLDYTHTLNWYAPADMIPALGVMATGAEIFFGVLLLVGWQTRIIALGTALLLLTFATAMTLALGIKAPLNYAVFSGIGGALLLASRERFPFSLDELLFRRAHSAVGSWLPADAPGRLGENPNTILTERLGRRDPLSTSAKSLIGLAILIGSGLVMAGTSMAEETITPLTSNDLADCSGKEALMYTVEFPPGFSSPVHHHDALISLYVLEGSVVMQVKGGVESTLTRGQTFFEGPRDVHVVSRNASRTESAKFIVFSVKDKDAPLVLMDK